MQRFSLARTKASEWYLRYHEVDQPFVLCYYCQFPVCLVSVMTIKAEGQTFDKVDIHLEEQVLTHWQLYIAFSIKG